MKFTRLAENTEKGMARHSAKVSNCYALGPETRRIDLRIEGEPMGFIGGQFIIVDSGLTHPDGRAAKRAYSFVTPDVQQGAFSLIVRRIGPGLVSNFMHNLHPGDEISFSGPWGKFVPPGVDTAAKSMMLIVTDTGITAALGLLNASRFEPFLHRTTLVWLRECERYFLTDAQCAELIPEGLAVSRILPAPTVDSKERTMLAYRLIDDLLAPTPGHAWLAGDWAVMSAVNDFLLKNGVTGDRIRIEPFFHYPVKQVAVPSAGKWIS